MRLVVFGWVSLRDGGLSKHIDSLRLLLKNLVFERSDCVCWLLVGEDVGWSVSYRDDLFLLWLISLASILWSLRF